VVHKQNGEDSQSIFVALVLRLFLRGLSVLVGEIPCTFLKTVLHTNNPQISPLLTVPNALKQPVVAGADPVKLNLLFAKFLPTTQLVVHVLQEQSNILVHIGASRESGADFYAIWTLRQIQLSTTRTIQNAFAVLSQAALRKHRLQILLKHQRESPRILQQICQLQTLREIQLHLQQAIVKAVFSLTTENVTALWIGISNQNLFVLTHL
jgi:hypothetical protein